MHPGRNDYLLLILLGPVVGEAAIQAQVNLTLDYNQVETTTEDFDNNDKGVKPRSEALTTERKYKLDPEGIPGSMTNSPPPDADHYAATETRLLAVDARGKLVRVEENGGFEGITEGLDPRGFLRVRTGDGVRTVLSGGVRAL